MLHNPAVGKLEEAAIDRHHAGRAEARPRHREAPIIDDGGPGVSSRSTDEDDHCGWRDPTGTRGRQTIDDAGGSDKGERVTAQVDGTGRETQSVPRNIEGLRRRDLDGNVEEVRCVVDRRDPRHQLDAVAGNGVAARRSGKADGVERRSRRQIVGVRQLRRPVRKRQVVPRHRRSAAPIGNRAPVAVSPRAGPRSGRSEDRFRPEQQGRHQETHNENPHSQALGTTVIQVLLHRLPLHWLSLPQLSSGIDWRGTPASRRRPDYVLICLSRTAGSYQATASYCNDQESVGLDESKRK